MEKTLQNVLRKTLGSGKEINEVVEGSNLYKPSATLEQLVLPEEPRGWASGALLDDVVLVGNLAIRFPGLILCTQLATGYYPWV